MRKVTREAIERYRAAKAALAANTEREKAAGIRHETDEYLRLNRELDEAAAAVPWRYRR